MIRDRPEGEETISPRPIRIRVSGTVQFDIADGRLITRVPLSFKRRGRSTVLRAPEVSGVTVHQPHFAWSLIQTLGKAFYWQHLLDTGVATNASALAKQLGLKPSWVAEVLRLTLLAPDIVKAIVEGKQPRELTLQALRGRQMRIPPDWQEQRVLFGFVQPAETALGAKGRSDQIG